MYTANDIALGFIEHGTKNGGIVSPLKIQKLLYYAQGWHLALKGEALFSDDIQAWDHGPVCKSVYHSYKQFGWDSIPHTEPAAISEDTMKFVAKIWKAYGQFSGKALEEMTHVESPWKDAYDGSKEKVIPLDAIKQYFLSR